MNECAENRQELAKSFKKFSKVFIALGDENRQQIFITLLKNENVGMRVPEITKQTHLSRPAVSHHLKILREAGLINMYPVGTMNYYYVDANESCWKGLKNFVDSVDTLVEKATKAGYPKWEEK